MSEIEIDSRIMVRATSGRWRATFRVRPDIAPPTEDEAAALAEAIVDALAAALGGQSVDVEVETTTP